MSRNEQKMSQIPHMAYHKIRSSAFIFLTEEQRKIFFIIMTNNVRNYEDLSNRTGIKVDSLWSRMQKIRAKMERVCTITTNFRIVPKL